MTSDEWPADRIAAALGSVGIVIGAFGPWLTANAGFMSATVSGMDGSDGKLLAVLGGVCVGFVLVRQYLVVAIAAAVALVVGALNYFDVSGRVDDLTAEDILASVGWGIYVACVGAAVAAFAGVRLVRAERAARKAAAVTTTQDPLPSAE
jgi:hypothetical protein